MINERIIKLINEHYEVMHVNDKREYVKILEKEKKENNELIDVLDMDNIDVINICNLENSIIDDAIILIS